MDNPDLKTSFAPIATPNITILILGTLPGDRSLELNEYYGHPRNRFWKIIASITKNELPLNYPEKKHLLERSTIGVWDVAHKAIRKGSLDSAIMQEEANDLDGFIAEHKNLQSIGFNGIKAEKLFNKYFSRLPMLTYILLPSSSPANAGISFDDLCKAWSRLLQK